MTDKEKLEKLEELADAMYYAAQYLTTDASRLHKAMDEYHQFIINEYHKEEPVSEDLEEVSEKFRWNIEESCYQNDNGTYTYSSDNIEEAFKAGAKWQKEQLMKDAVEAKITLLDGISYVDKNTLSQYKAGDKVKIVIVKED